VALDFIKVILTYTVALTVIIGGGAILLADIQLDDLTKGALIGFMGMALNWVFGESTRGSTARQTTRALMTNTSPTITTTATTTPASVKTTTTPAAAPEEKENP
jgi:hypothetical protein